MRALVPIVAFLALNLSSASVRAFSGDNKPPDPDAIAALEARANQAQPREQTFLYAELVQQMTELSIRQYAAGDAEKATNLLKRIQQIAQKIHLSSLTTTSVSRTPKCCSATPPSASTRCSMPAAWRIARWWSKPWRR